jgi:multiple sugar transport system substrate-binding protein
MSDMSAEQAFIIQKVAMLNSGIWSAGIINKSVGETFDWDIAMFPRAPGKPHAVVGTGGSGWGVLKYSKHPELAWELVKLMSGEQMQRTICSLPNSSQQPSIIALSKSPDVWLKFPPKPRNKAILNTAMDYVVFSPFDPRWWEVWRKFATPELEKVWLKQKTLKEAVEIIETEANKAFSEPL